MAASDSPQVTLRTGPAGLEAYTSQRDATKKLPAHKGGDAEPDQNQLTPGAD